MAKICTYQNNPNDSGCALVNAQRKEIKRLRARVARLEAELDAARENGKNELG